MEEVDHILTDARLMDMRCVLCQHVQEDWVPKTVGFFVVYTMPSSIKCENCKASSTFFILPSRPAGKVVGSDTPCKKEY